MQQPMIYRWTWLLTFGQYQRRKQITVLFNTPDNRMRR
jgi:hypothetical protein